MTIYYFLGVSTCSYSSIDNIPMDIAPTVQQSLSRSLQTVETIPTQWKKKLSYKSSLMKQNIKPYSVVLHYLMTKNLYKNAYVSTEHDLLNNMLQTSNEEKTDEVDHNVNQTDVHQDKSDTFN